VSVSRAQDFEVYYEVRLGIRREPGGDEDGDGDGGGGRGYAPLGSGSAGSTRPSAAHANGGADLAVFEQFERLVRPPFSLYIPPLLWMISCYCFRDDFVIFFAFSVLVPGEEGGAAEWSN
jgi:hypothetical protein